ncbi:hypothetical protein [Actimicrobium sp. CCI2.3]|uniref:hypothetical protein n=1 Tax=Actimicrobium sp. CCI2.3 TaxID=3048616 RepID=UPI002AB4B1C3|nr:hypothetical protein [Actimicrobium sp. CCI2.3]MDY7573229.1 hypothetical protein [Actimicrobium sp. CCI2.3]MEB0022863.1 hypothetical protein [Actimicrobium sp. CCI2.3]
METDQFPDGLPAGNEIGPVPLQSLQAFSCQLLPGGKRTLATTVRRERIGAIAGRIELADILMQVGDCLV